MFRVFFISFFLSLVNGSDIPTVKDGAMELKMIHIVWRHGDRSPTTTFKADPFQEDAWKFGGGGWGQLSPLGMYQHLNLGKKLRNRYVNAVNSTYRFLPAVYDQKTIYVRSTGINRTLISATSNMLGMYGQNGYGNTAGTDFPDALGWPPGFVPIPIHTVDYDSDHIGNMDSVCPRREWLWNLAQQSDEMKEWRNSEAVSSVIDKLTSLVNETWSLEDFWIVPDALFIEQIYYNDTLRKKNAWYSDDFYNQIVAVNDQIYMFQYGIFNKTVTMQNMNIGLELLKVRSGPLMNDMVDRIKKKSDCTYGTNLTDCNWINGLKYFVYSAHDETVYAVLVALGIERFAIIPHGYPLYSAAVSVEYWRNTTDNADYFKLVYHKQSGDDFTVMTSEIEGCVGEYCSMNVLEQIAKKLKPDQPIDQWCLVTESSSSISISISILIFFATFFNHFLL
uniref:Histidine acid phosphatase n=1 Tax=Caenorhabditis tropicalis TaxID=1561998 RepID=A0A1I7UYQ9_9PELO